MMNMKNGNEKYPPPRPATPNFKMYQVYEKEKKKENQLLLMHFTSWNDLQLQTSSYVQLHEDMQHIQLGGC